MVTAFDKMQQNTTTMPVAPFIYGDEYCDGERQPSDGVEFMLRVIDDEGSKVELKYKVVRVTYDNPAENREPENLLEDVAREHKQLQLEPPSTRKLMELEYNW